MNSTIHLSEERFSTRKPFSKWCNDCKIVYCTVVLDSMCCGKCWVVFASFSISKIKKGKQGLLWECWHERSCHTPQYIDQFVLDCWAHRLGLPSMMYSLSLQHLTVWHALLQKSSVCLSVTYGCFPLIHHLYLVPDHFSILNLLAAASQDSWPSFMEAACALQVREQSQVPFTAWVSCLRPWLARAISSDCYTWKSKSESRYTWRYSLLLHSFNHSRSTCKHYLFCYLAILLMCVKRVSKGNAAHSDLSKQIPKLTSCSFLCLS